MNATTHMILGYGVGIVVLWGYALTLWLGLRNVTTGRRQQEEPRS